MVLRSEGLYDAKLTLVPALPLPGPPPPGAPDGPSATPAAAAGGDGAAAADPAGSGSRSGSQPARWHWRLINFVLLVGVPFYDPGQKFQLLHTVNQHLVYAADNAAYVARKPGGGAAASAAGGPAPQPSASAAASEGGAPVVSATAAVAGLGRGREQGVEAALRACQGDEVAAPLAVMHRCA